MLLLRKAQKNHIHGCYRKTSTINSRCPLKSWNYSHHFNCGSILGKPICPKLTSWQYCQYSVYISFAFQLTPINLCFFINFLFLYVTNHKPLAGRLFRLPSPFHYFRLPKRTISLPHINLQTFPLDDGSRYLISPLCLSSNAIWAPMWSRRPHTKRHPWSSHISLLLRDFGRWIQFPTLTSLLNALLGGPAGTKTQF